MAKVLEYLSNAFDFDQTGWIVLIMLAAPMLYMLFYFINHWAFRIVTGPLMVLGAVLCNSAMNDLALHVTDDKTVNQGIGFGTGMVTIMLAMSFAFWCWYEAIGE